MKADPVDASGSPQHMIWARMARYLLDIADLGGVDYRSVFEGLPFDAISLPTMRQIRWEDYAILVERLEERAGSPAAFGEVIRSTYTAVTPELQALARVAVTPSTLYRFLYGVVNPIVFPPVQHEILECTDERFVLRFSVRPGARPALAVFRATTPGLCALPNHLGLPDAVVTAELGATRSTFDIRLPKVAPRLERLRDAASAAAGRIAFNLGFSGEDASLDVTLGAGLIDPPNDDRDEATRVSIATTKWLLTPRQIEVLTLVVHGLSNKEIAQAQGRAENTIELHMTHLLRKAGVTSRTALISRFWAIT